MEQARGLRGNREKDNEGFPNVNRSRNVFQTRVRWEGESGGAQARAQNTTGNKVQMRTIGRKSSGDSGKEACKAEKGAQERPEVF